MPYIVRMNVTPVKSMALSHPEEVDLVDVGIAENRLFYLVDEDGAAVLGLRFRSAADHPGRLRPRAGASCARRSRTASVAEGDAAVVHGRPDHRFLRQARARPRRSRPVERGVLRRSSVGRSDWRRCDQPGDGSDVYHLTLVSNASVAELAERGGHYGDLDAARFRMTFELDGCAAHEEDTWAGRRIRVGKALLRVYGQVPRCVVTTQSPETGLKDFETLKIIASYRTAMTDKTGLPFGMYAEVEHPGRVRVGDSVEVQG